MLSIFYFVIVRIKIFLLHVFLLVFTAKIYSYTERVMQEKNDTRLTDSHNQGRLMSCVRVRATKCRSTKRTYTPEINGSYTSCNCFCITFPTRITHKFVNFVFFPLFLRAFADPLWGHRGPPEVREPQVKNRCYSVYIK